ncbi:MAG: hypothetical protein IJ661_11100 [Lachnospiraceae bacterium]|nr:hypothetical protein [Lachnospiraceae bacterium]
MPRKKKETDAAKEVGSIAETEKEDILQTDLETEVSNTTGDDHNLEETEGETSHQTEIENSLEADDGDSQVSENSQTDIDNFADNAGQDVEPEGSLLNSNILSQSGGEAVEK